MKKRPFASEGHLHLPTDLAPPGRASGSGGWVQPPDAASDSVRLLRDHPLAAGTRSLVARIRDDDHVALGLCRGDEVLVRADRPWGEQSGTWDDLRGGGLQGDARDSGHGGCGDVGYGDLVLVHDAGSLRFWKAYPEADVLLLRSGDEEHRVPVLRGSTATGRTVVIGRVLAVRRPLPR